MTRLASHNDFHLQDKNLDGVFRLMCHTFGVKMANELVQNNSATIKVAVYEGFSDDSDMCRQ